MRLIVLFAIFNPIRYNFCEMYEPDSLDKKLVVLMGEDASLKSETLAQKLNVSSATVRRRLKKLVENNLVQIVGIVDPGKFGYNLHVVFALDVAHNHLDSNMEILNKRPEIEWIAITAGRYNIVAIAWFTSFDNLLEFLQNPLSTLEGIRDTETSVCFDIKKGRFVPLTPLGE